MYCVRNRQCGQGHFKEGVIKMTKRYIAMTSITYAMKAKTLLNEKKFYCEIERTPKNLGTGCGYSIVVKADPQEVAAVLSQNRIPYKEIL